MNKKLLFIFTGVFFCFLMRISIINNEHLKNDFSELNNLEIYVQTEDINEVIKISKMIGQFDKYVSYSYIDPSSELFLYNSLKKSTIKEIDKFSFFFKKPTFNNLIVSMGVLSNDYKGNYNVINSIISEIFNFCSDNNPYIYSNIITSILNDPKIHISKMDNYKIVAKSKKVFKSLDSKRYAYNQLFRYIDSINDTNQYIKYIKFNNKVAHNCFVEYKKKSNTKINCKYSPSDIIYFNTLEELTVFENKIKMYFPKEVQTTSINDYLTDSTLIKDKYKKIRNLYLNISRSDKMKSKYSIKEIIESLSILDSNISKSGDRSDFLVLNQVDYIYNYFKDNQNTNNLNQFIMNYNIQIPKIVRSIANTEPVSIDFVSPYVYNEFFNSSANRYVLKIEGLKVNNLIQHTDLLYQNHSSINFYLYLFILNVIIFILSVLSITTITKNYFLKRSK